ncbi:MAG: response regulator [Proteobacteria bacterium]|uniref:response regulator n=1 Tax=Pseudopelagicola sp. nBUS_20 TaxID=3395317 RepID=UPI003EBCB985|nr:response regulator [Pseudomonadota bacterium]
MKQKILVVDDEASVRETIRLQLKSTGHEIIEAEDGQQAISLLGSSNNRGISVIICDVRMPNITGIEAVSHFRRDHPSIPVIVLTGYPDVKLAVDFVAKGVFDYVVKPVEKERLIAKVEKAAIQSAAMKVLD